MWDTIGEDDTGPAAPVTIGVVAITCADVALRKAWKHAVNCGARSSAAGPTIFVTDLQRRLVEHEFSERLLELAVFVSSAFSRMASDTSRLPCWAFQLYSEAPQMPCLRAGSVILPGRRGAGKNFPKCGFPMRFRIFSVA